MEAPHLCGILLYVSMLRGSSQFKTSLISSFLVGAVGAFIFWGVFAGWFSGGDDTRVQVAAPAASEEMSR